jgi:BirA family biotin operon repressor/biotin-[acetyl-CoA-carboxylase] ligase
VLAGYLSDLTHLYERWCAHDGDPSACGLLAEATRLSATLGRTVRVELPGGGLRTGTARMLDDGGRLVVDVEGEAEPLVVAAGDVTHLRHTD